MIRQILPDSQIHLVWQCPDCLKLASVGPEFAQDSGNPMCPDCDTEMEYQHTEVDIP